MGNWLKDVKDADKVGLLILYTGIMLVMLSTGAGVWVAHYHFSNEGILDRELSTIKDMFGIGAALITTAMGVLRFQSKTNGNGNPPVPPVPPIPPVNGGPQ